MMTNETRTRVAELRELAATITVELARLAATEDGAGNENAYFDLRSVGNTADSLMRHLDRLATV
jgi:hypothetical protein